MKREEEPTEWERTAAQKDWDYYALAWNKGWPPWECTTPQQRLLMEAKVNNALDYLAEKGVIEASKPGSPGEQSFMSELMQHDIEAAIERRDRERLRRLFNDRETLRMLLEQEEFRDAMVKWLLREWPDHRRKTSLTPLELASFEVDQVRQIWRREYDGLWKRRKENGPLAEDIVARRFQRAGQPVTKHDLKAHCRKHGKSPLK